MRVIFVPIGYPGAGKTFYYNKHIRKGLMTRIDMDVFIGRKLEDVLPDVLKTQGNLYLDGLFITEASQNILLGTNETIAFIYFNTSKETCLENDRTRNRKQSSAAIIKHAKIHKPKNVFFTIG